MFKVPGYYSTNMPKLINFIFFIPVVFVRNFAPEVREILCLLNEFSLYARKLEITQDNMDRTHHRNRLSPQVYYYMGKEVLRAEEKMMSTT